MHPATSTPAPQITAMTAGWAYRQGTGVLMTGQPYRQAGYRQQDGRIDGGAGILTGAMRIDSRQAYRRCEAAFHPHAASPSLFP